MNQALPYLLQYIEAGGFVMPPLLLLTLVLWFAIGYRVIALRRGSVRGARVLIQRYRAGQKPHGRGILPRALEKGMAIQRRNMPHMRRYLDDAFAAELRDMRRYHVLIMTIVLVSPLLGLLGTVVGMIETFDSLGDMSLFSQSGGIAGGISQALFTTQMGLAVAIPGMVVNGILYRRQKNIEMELAQMKDILCAEVGQ